jgi:PilZ domain.
MDLINQTEPAVSQPDPAIERRQQPRLSCKPPFPASFDCAEGRISAYVDDINVEGAKLRVPFANNRIPFLIQGEFEYVFHTELGPFQRRARTAWIQRIEGDFFWGIEFIRIGEDPQDALFSLIKNYSPQAM